MDGQDRKNVQNRIFFTIKHLNLSRNKTKPLTHRPSVLSKAKIVVIIDDLQLLCPRYMHTFIVLNVLIMILHNEQNSRMDP